MTAGDSAISTPWKAIPDGGRGEVRWASVFPDGDGGGNPCAVVCTAERWSERRMLRTAAALQVETVFVLAPRGDGDTRLRFFTPWQELNICVHGTVAAVLMLAARGLPAGRPARMETRIGTVAVDWDTASSRATLELPAPQIAAMPGDEMAALLRALRIGEEALAPAVGPIESVSTGRAKLLVPLRDESVLDALAPGHNELWTLCDRLRVTGVYAFTVDARDADAAARQFPLRAGFIEDPATGVAAAALAAYLALHHRPPSGEGWHEWSIAQGRAMQRPSRISACALVGSAGTVVATRAGGLVRPAAAPVPAASRPPRRRRGRQEPQS